MNARLRPLTRRVLTAIRGLGLLALGCGTPEGVPAASLAEKVGAGADAVQTGSDAAAANEARVEVFSIDSTLLRDFGGEKTSVEASVLLPPGHDPTKRYPVNYYVHGFGGSHGQAASSHGRLFAEMMKDGRSESIIHVFLDATHPMGHHAFADSANTGPWGQALVQEFVPAVEKKFGGAGVSWGRFISGHSSGGWSSLWLQVMYPDSFGGVWSTAPDPVDFRDFTGIDLYAESNVYTDPQGEAHQLMRRGDAWVMSFEDYVRKEAREQPRGGQIYSFDAVFSPRATPKQPKLFFDRGTGEIDATVIEAWKKYDIALLLREQWPHLGPKLAGKLNIFVGTLDTFGLDGAVKLLDVELDKLGSDATIVYVDERSHFDLGEPSQEHYPKGLKQRVVDEMWAAWQAGEAKAGAAQ